MATYLDMSLDDMIKSRNPSGRGRGQGRGRGRGRARGRDGATGGRGRGTARQGPLRVNARPSPYKIAKSFNRAKDLIWRHDLFDESMKAAGLTGVETGTKLYISNLDYGVSNEDIKELFSEIGPLRRSAVHYERNGRPSELGTRRAIGTGTVVDGLYHLDEHPRSIACPTGSTSPLDAHCQFGHPSLQTLKRIVPSRSFI